MRMTSMAGAVEIDLGAALRDGRLAATQYARLLQTCNGARCGGQCDLWRHAQYDIGSESELSEPPDFCVNREALNKLKP